MADFKNYSGTNIEADLLATTSSAGLMSATDKGRVDTVDTTMELITEEDIDEIWGVNSNEPN